MLPAVDLGGRVWLGGKPCNGYWVLRSLSRIGFQFDGLSEIVSRLGIQLIRRSAVFHQSSYSQTQLRLSAETLGVIHDASPK